MSSKEDVIKQCIAILGQIIEDGSIPRNIRRAADGARAALFDTNTPPVIRAASAMSILNEVSNDLNIPLHARTLIWSVASQLERVSIDI
ncbi:MAG: UPF0147 family protein [Methanocellales archaeon]|nr:UPF0147 family protein [Methanocellales archaeon]MDD3291664.1 UPF0147 family protein [Methanocellales archaeon]MDD5235014.1 UPF0147 family protein [Methanocellales archaeon]MDD5485152.1 UPF0147 family protein [Methanocellales archaeon]